MSNAELHAELDARYEMAERPALRKLAAHAGCSRQTVWDALHRNRPIGAITLKKILNALGAEYDVFIPSDPKPATAHERIIAELQAIRETQEEILKILKDDH